VERIHRGLAAVGLHPTEHLVDAGYTTSAAIHAAAEYHGIVLIGPIRADPQAAKHPGFAKADFTIDWETRTMTCPNGVVSPPWKPTTSDVVPGGVRAVRTSRLRGHRLRDRPRPRPAPLPCKGLSKIHVQHVLTAAGTHIIRLFAYDPPDEHPPSAAKQQPPETALRPPRRASPKITNSIQDLCQNRRKPPSSAVEQHGRPTWPG